ncbi:hypothetical protein KQX54_003998 [Cotesia glomerata]|uniref:Neurotransmitter-gated ion-channel ligand-binding domain-containing protein n=1 Tax=Cotesia glomerata TaxID=32391 RepID=A0AAV7HP56_COTGL|nr:hypothetical protein KQX54_003998 [Cotesia glomerata]
MQSMTSIILLVYRPVAFHIQHRSYNLELVSRHVSEPQFECNCGANERRLLKDLLDKYNTLERPVANESEALEVKFGITLQQIIDVFKTVSFQRHCELSDWSETLSNDNFEIL